MKTDFFGAWFIKMDILCRRRGVSFFVPVFMGAKSRAGWPMRQNFRGRARKSADFGVWMGEPAKKSCKIVEKY
ncbi:MAG TPA: hypothetical protein IAC40_08035 [Candidatus Faecivivens stercorigallinarum]|nr:hypothetical protein [Candidatus Faecivivens stercorigallinarum]